MFKLRKVMSIVLAATLLLVNSTSVFAATDEKGSDQSWEARKAYIEENMIRLGSEGFDKVDEWLKLNGIEKISAQDTSVSSTDGLKWTPGTKPELNMSWNISPAQWPATNQIIIYSWATD